MHRISNSTFSCTLSGAAGTKQPSTRFKVCDLGASEDAEPLLPRADSISFFKFEPEPGDKTSGIKLLCQFAAKKNGAFKKLLFKDHPKVKFSKTDLTVEREGFQRALGALPPGPR
jgi:hypothetical protein